MAKDGSDQNPCTLDEPWLTIQHAVETLVAGGYRSRQRGTYHESVYIARGGNEGNDIVFSAYPNETPVIDGTGVTESENGLIIIYQKPARQLTMEQKMELPQRMWKVIPDPQGRRYDIGAYER